MPQRIRIYNTLSRKKEFLPHTGNKPLRLFVCGPTVYDYPHLGHARTYVLFDAFVKYLRSRAVKVTYLQNITDIDDKIIARAKETGGSPMKIAQKYLGAYLKNMEMLGVTAVTSYAPATKHISHIVTQVKLLLKKGCAYKIDGDGYYFDISKFPAYGKLSGRTALQAEDAVSRIDESIGKRQRGDFCLWKFPHGKGAPPPPAGKREGTKAPGRMTGKEPAWWTPLGWGRPGWHIEDTAISHRYFGPQYDIHGGGMDLTFPHHEAEIAQAEAAYGKTPFVKIWMHTGFLTVRGEKMSKSLKNFLTIETFLKRFRPEILRLLVLCHHYRTPLDYTDDLAESTAKAWEGVGRFLIAADLIGQHDRLEKSAGCRPAAQKKSRELEKRFFSALADDFNTPKALAAIFSYIADLHPQIWGMRKAAAEKARSVVARLLGILGFPKQNAPKIPRKISALAKEREKYRTNKQFMQADRLRKRLNALGYEIEDTPAGPLLLPTKLWT